MIEIRAKLSRILDVINIRLQSTTYTLLNRIIGGDRPLAINGLDSSGKAFDSSSVGSAPINFNAHHSGLALSAELVIKVNVIIKLVDIVRRFSTFTLHLLFDNHFLWCLK